jgi:hypothetical protein
MYPPAEAVSYPSNPYRKSKTQGPAGATFGLAHVQALLATGISNSVRASYWQKYFVHRAVRPEAYGGLAHHRLANGVSDYPLHDNFLKSEALDRSKAKYGTYLLSQTYPEAAPLHSTYPGGATSVGAVTATILKAFFDESRVIANPVQPDPADPTRLVPYSGPPLTVGGELNKLAVNFGFGRNWAGIHWRSDASASMALGEEVAIGMLRDERTTLREPFRRLLLHALRRQPRDNLTAAGRRPCREAPARSCAEKRKRLCPTAYWWKLSAAPAQLTTAQAGGDPRSDHLMMRVGLI